MQQQWEVAVGMNWAQILFLPFSDKGQVKLELKQQILPLLHMMQLARLLQIQIPFPIHGILHVSCFIGFVAITVCI